jgi:MarR family transcriptional regulator, lower aerobic nicotinate degradation pathway regulator
MDKPYSCPMNVVEAPQRLRSLPSWLLAQLSMEARRVAGDVLTAHDLHRSQYALMASLEEFGPLSQAELSDRSGLDRSDVVRWVDELEARGFAGRTRDPGDRRRNMISLTATGRRQLAKLDALLGKAQTETLARLSPAEQQQLVRLLGQALGLT